MLNIFNIEDFLTEVKSKSYSIVELKIIETIFEIFKLQDGFQQKAMANDQNLPWWEVEESNSKKVDYSIAILGEIGEAIESTDFKWWAKTLSEDKENFITELVDCLHFSASEVMKQSYGLKKFANENNISEATFQSLMEEAFINFTEVVSLDLGYDTLNKVYKKGDRELALKSYVAITLLNNLDFEFLNVQFEQSIRSHLLSPIAKLIEVAVISGVTFKELAVRYKIKNALNQVRKLNGYKEGTYQKQWISIKTGIICEDNVVALQECLHLDLNLTEMIDFLNNYYRENVNI